MKCGRSFLGMAFVWGSCFCGYDVSMFVGVGCWVCMTLGTVVFVTD